MDKAIFDYLGRNESWGYASDILLYASFAILACFAIIGLVQLIRRKSLKKVDAELLAMIPPLALMAIIYVVFDKLIIVHTRPISEDPSFPSTHVMVTSLILAMVMSSLPKFIEELSTRKKLYFVLTAVIVVVAYGRIASGMHWFSDVLGGLFFAFLLWIFYTFIVKKVKGKKNE